MSTLDSFLPSVRPFAPGVTDQTAYKAIRNAAIEFCERTRLWRFEDTFNVTIEDCNSGIYTPAGSILHDIDAILFNGEKLHPSTTSDLDRREKGWRTNELGGGLPKWYTQIDQGTIRIVPAMEGTVYICARLKPTQDTNNIPEFIANEYQEVIGWGALGRILMVPAQSYSNPDLGQYYFQRFTDKLDKLSNKSVTGQQNAPKRTRPSFY